MHTMARARSLARLALLLKEEHEERGTRDFPRTGVPRKRSGVARRAPTRWLAACAVVLVLLALFIVVTQDNSREYRVMMQNAGQLVPGDLVRIGGVQAGSVKDLELTPDGQAVVTVSLGKDWGHLHAGTTVTVR